MLRLYHNDMSVCAAKVRIALAEKGLAWDGVHMNLRAGDTLKPDYLKLNPGGVVPTLVDGDTVVIESTIICEYLDDKQPAPALKPADAAGRARMRLWTKRVDDDYHPAVGVLSISIAFRHQHLKKSKAEIEAYLAAVPNEARRERMRYGIERGMDSPLFAPALAKYEGLLDDMQATLSHSPWLAGDAYSLADIGYTPYLARLDHLGLGALIDRRPAVRDWTRRIEARPSYQTAVRDWFNPAYMELFAQTAPEARARMAQLRAA